MALICLELPWFPKGITAHNKGGWRGKADKVKEMRSVAMLIAAIAKRRDGALVGPIWIEYEFHTTSKRRDEANTIQCCKPYVDGLVDAGLIPGDRYDQLKTWGAEFVILPRGKQEKVIVRLLSLENAVRPRLEENSN